MNRSKSYRFERVLYHLPDAVALISGSDEYPDIDGVAKLFQTSQGVIICTEVTGLPIIRGYCHSPIFAYHIHDGGACTGNKEDPFADSGMHYNPKNCPHPWHAGDLPPLFGSADGTAFSVFLTDRFHLREVIGKTMIIHNSPDDFTTQPSGNSGKKIACGEISLVRR